MFYSRQNWIGRRARQNHNASSCLSTHMPQIAYCLTCWAAWRLTATISQVHVSGSVRTEVFVVVQSSSSDRASQYSTASPCPAVSPYHITSPCYTVWCITGTVNTLVQLWTYWLSGSVDEPNFMHFSVYSNSTRKAPTLFTPTHHTPSMTCTLPLRSQPQLNLLQSTVLREHSVTIWCEFFHSFT